jgi:hypothetical protein
VDQKKKVPAISLALQIVKAMAKTGGYQGKIKITGSNSHLVNLSAVGHQMQMRFFFLSDLRLGIYFLPSKKNKKQ